MSGEQIYQVSPLGLPDPHRISPPESVGSSEAVRLFVARAQALRREFALTEHNAPAVVTLCERLDGIPLAIELAAARIGSMAVEGLAKRLDERFGLLTLGPRDAPPVQQTLRATMDWSWQLLGALEQALLRRLSVFVGGWTLAAAEAVCSGIDIEVPAVLELLNGFANKSLLSLDATGTYALLETVRQYAGERLVEAGEDITIRQQHLDWCVASAEEAEPRLIGPEQGS